jgi:hypothetical protein
LVVHLKPTNCRKLVDAVRGALSAAAARRKIPLVRYFATRITDKLETN